MNAMSEDHRIMQVGSLLLHWGSLDEMCFGRAPVWCEYYDPDELETMRVWGGISHAWLDEHIIGRLEGTNRSVWYAPADDLAAPRCEIMAISATLCLGDREMNGFLTVVDGEITSGAVFADGQPGFIFSLADVLDEHNHEELSRLADGYGVPKQQLLPIRYTTRGKNPYGIASGTLDIPVTPPSEVESSSDAR